RGRHPPLGVIDGLSDLVDSASRFEESCIAYIADEVSRCDLHGAVVAPLVGISNLIAHALKFQDRLLFRFGTHPVELLNALSHCFFNAADHVERARLESR